MCDVNKPSKITSLPSCLRDKKEVNVWLFNKPSRKSIASKPMMSLITSYGINGKIRRFVNLAMNSPLKWLLIIDFTTESTKKIKTRKITGFHWNTSYGISCRGISSPATWVVRGKIDPIFVIFWSKSKKKDTGWFFLTGTPLNLLSVGR